MAWSARRFSLRRELPLPREQVWELLSHTDRLNRAVGLPVVNFEPVDRDDATLARPAHARIAGLPMAWRELPFHWVREQSYSVLREFDSGPIRRFVGGLELTDAAIVLDDGAQATNLHLYAELMPANAIGALLIPFIARTSLRRTLNYVDRYLAEKQRGHDTLRNTALTSHINTAQLSRRLGELRRQPVQTAQIEALEAFLRERGDDEVAAIRPYELAAGWEAEPDEVLRLCLHATRCGLLNLSWNLMCPNCRVSKVAVGSLAEVTEQFHCDLCGVAYSANFDRYVELKFAVHPALREAVENTYCVGGPFVSPHVLVQRPLQRGETCQVKVPSVSARLRLRVLRSNHSVELGEPNERAANSGEVALELGDEGWTWPEGAPLASRSLCVTNRSSRDVVIVLEKIDWDVKAVTAARVTAMQEFRDLFSSEVLAPGQHVGIESLTLFFSDLRDSTALYETLKDAPAYNRVRRHFDFLFGHIATDRGSVVKTIGDSVMAVFYTPEDALRASLEIQRGVEDFNATLPEGESISIKIGLHHGPAIAINSNDRLDYFGRTVNIAARVQSRSTGDDIVMSRSCFECEGVQESLRNANATVEKFQCDLKGLVGVFDLYRVRLSSSFDT